MPDLEFYESPDFWLNKKLEAMDNDEFPFVRNSSNVTDCEYENSFIFNTKIDVKKLIKDLSSSYFKKHKFDARSYTTSRFVKKNYKEETIKNSVAIKDNFEGIQNKIILNQPLHTEAQQSQKIEDLYYDLLSKSFSLNTTECYIHTLTRNNSFDINIDIYDKKITYTYTIYFKTPDKNSAIVLKTGSVGSFFFFLEKVYGKREANILRRAIYIKYVNALKSASNIGTLVFLYKNLPHYIKRGYDIESNEETKPYKIPDGLLWKHFNKFVKYDEGTADASYYVLNVMTLMTPYFCMMKFLEDQSLVLKVYNGLDDRSAIDTFFGTYELSETYNLGSTTLALTNKDAFVTILNSYMQLFETNGDLCVFESTGVHYRQGTVEGIEERVIVGNFKEKLYGYKEEYRLNSNIISSNTGENKNKVYLINYLDITRDYGENFNQNGSVSTVYKYINGYSEKGYYNPLDVVKFTQYNKNGEAITMNVPALFVKYASDVKEWERVNKGIRFGFNVLQIVVSVSTIYSGASSLTLYAALADLGLAYTDTIIQGGKEKGYFKGKEGEKFLKSWEQIYTVGSIATFSPLAVKFVATNAPKMVNYGADLLQVTGKTITNKKMYERVWELTTKAIHNIEIPNFSKTGLQILRKGVSIPGLKYASKLQDVGVLFVKNIHNDIVAIYKNVPIAIGKAKEIWLQLREAAKLGKEKLLAYLQDLVDVCRIVINNFRFINIIRYVMNNRILKKYLSIHEEAIIIFYTASGFQDLNKALRGLLPLKKEYISFERLLNKALDKLPNSIYNSPKHILYRSVEMSEELIQKLFVGKTEYIEYGFISTSHNKTQFLDNWFHFKPSHNVIFKIQGKNGKLVEAISDIGDEAEVLFKSKTKFEIVSLKPTPHPLSKKLEIYEIILKEK